LAWEADAPWAWLFQPSLWLSYLAKAAGFLVALWLLACLLGGLWLGVKSFNEKPKKDLDA